MCFDWAAGEIYLTTQAGGNTGAGNWALADSWTTTGSEGASSGWEVDPTEKRPDDVAELNYPEAAADLVPSTINEPEYSEEEVRQAFWELLKTAGYEVWGT